MSQGEVKGPRKPDKFWPPDRATAIVLLAFAVASIGFFWKYGWGAGILCLFLGPVGVEAIRSRRKSRRG